MFSDFKKAVEEIFCPYYYDEHKDAIDEMRKMWMTTQSSMDEHIIRFKILVMQSGLDESIATMELFRETLTLTLQRRLLRLHNPQSTLSEWYEKASRFHKLDNSYYKTQRTFGRRNNDVAPNIMGVDALSTDERSDLMKKGACFRCKKIGHLSKDCPDKNTNKRNG